MTDEDEDASGPASGERVRSRPVNRGLLLGATFFSIGATSTAVQALTALALGSFDNYRWGWSTGGLVAVVALIYMAARRPARWSMWWQRVWPWVLVTAVLAFGVMVAAFRPSTTTEGLPFDSSFGLVSEWANVDEPAKLAEVETGNLNIVMSDINTCHVGQDWGECINANIDEYNKVCVGLSLSDSAKRLCEDYEAVIVDMQNRGGAGWTVTTLGGWGGLSTEAETKLDSIPAVSHVAVCYFGLFGECS